MRAPVVRKTKAVQTSSVPVYIFYSISMSTALTLKAAGGPTSSVFFLKGATQAFFH